MEEKSHLGGLYIVGLELATTGFRVRVLTVRPERHLVVSGILEHFSSSYNTIMG